MGSHISVTCPNKQQVLIKHSPLFAQGVFHVLDKNIHLVSVLACLHQI